MDNSKNKKLIVIDNYDSFTYNLVHYVEAITNNTPVVVKNDQITINDIKSFDKIILSPGPGLPSNAGILKEVIKEFASTKKILGVCLGMQAIAEVFGASIFNLNQVFHGVASSIQVTQPSSTLFKGLPEFLTVGRYHSWGVKTSTIPHDLEVTSIDENGLPMSLQHSKYEVYGVQFHPESILTEKGIEIIRNFLSL